MHIVINIVNILLYIYNYFYANMCNNTVARSVKRNTQIIEQLLKHHEAETWNNLSNVKAIIVCTTPLSTGGGAVGRGLNLRPNFQNGRGLTGSKLLEGVDGKESGDYFQGVGCNFHTQKY